MIKISYIFAFLAIITLGVFYSTPIEANSEHAGHDTGQSDHAGYYDWSTSTDSTCGATVTLTRVCTKNGQKPRPDGDNILPDAACIAAGFGQPTMTVVNPPCPPPVHTYSYTEWGPANNNVCGETVIQTRSCIEDGDVNKIVDVSNCSNLLGGVTQTIVNPPCPPPPPPPTPTASLFATKIVCDDESDLPNWGDGKGSDDIRVSINSNTATDFLASHPKCRAVPEWKFEWALDLNNPGDNVGTGGSGWNAFSVSTLAQISGSKLWVREQVDNLYIPFTGANTTLAVSAELYCHNDALNYDNYDYISNPVANQSYYCVGFNTLKDGNKPKTKVCGDETATNYDSDVSSSEVVDNTVCTYPETPKTKICDIPTATNYDANLGEDEVVDNTICVYPEVPKTKVCGDETATNYDSDVSSSEVVDNTVCTYPETQKTKVCNVSTATNYDATLGEDEVVDNTTCVYPVAPKALCGDGIDNDNDGKTDYPADPGCASLTDNDETNSSRGGGVIGSYARTQGEVIGEVLGAETSCGIYVNKFLRRGSKNNDVEAVKKVQNFLNTYMKASIIENGVFGPVTESELKKFQLKHSEKILSPWKLTQPTGIFYLTTQTEVNNIMCPDLKLPIPELYPLSI